jgi:glutamate--cysteine ligase
MTLDRSTAGELERPIESAADLVDFFRAGEKPRAEWKLGMEHENLGLYEGAFAPVPYDGERGIAALLERYGHDGGWKPVTEAGALVALDRDGQSITLEPGGQLELSGRPYRSATEAADEFREHLAALKRVSAPFGIAWLALGMQPLHDTARAPRIPKERYRIMREFLPPRGSMAMDMMHVTASVQVSFDFADEADMASKLRTSFACAPIVSAIYANSSLAGGKPTGFVSKRMVIWRHTDPARCGVLPFVFEPGFGYAAYADWALDVPMFFILRDARYIAMQAKTFRQFLREGHEGEHATLEDWNRHLTTVFPDVRMKRVLEMRGADSCPADLVCSVPALWKGLLYDREAREAAFGLVSAWSEAEREAAYDAVARQGLAAEANGQKVLDLARELLVLAREGLARARDLAGEGDELGLLEPIAAQLALGKSPGQVVLEEWEGAFGRAPDRLIEYARY